MKTAPNKRTPRSPWAGAGVVGDGRVPDRPGDRRWRRAGRHGVGARQTRQGTAQDRRSTRRRGGSDLRRMADDQSCGVGAAPGAHALADQPDRARHGDVVAVVGWGLAGSDRGCGHGGAHRVAAGRPRVLRCVGGSAPAGVVAALDGLRPQAAPVAARLRPEHHTTRRHAHGGDSESPRAQHPSRPQPGTGQPVAPGAGCAFRCVLGRGPHQTGARPETRRLRRRCPGVGLSPRSDPLPGPRTHPQCGFDRFPASQPARRSCGLPRPRHTGRCRGHDR
jgi:hypothetical protein